MDAQLEEQTQAVEDLISALNKQKADLHSASQTPTGEAAVQATQRRMAAFIKESDDFEARREFNNWFVSSGVVLVIDMKNGTAEFGRGEVQIERRKKTLLSLSLLEEDAAALGASDQQIEQLGRDIARRNANLAEQRKAAKKAEEERRRNRVPMTPERKAEIKAWVEMKQKEVFLSVSTVRWI